MSSFIKITLIFLVSSSIYADGYAVITSKKNVIEKISKKQIKNIFLKKQHFIDAQKIVPVNISANIPFRLEFEKNVLKMDREQLNTFWTKQHFQGVTPPITQSSLNSLKHFIQNVEGAIGYIPKEEIDDSFKVLYEF